MTKMKKTHAPLDDIAAWNTWADEQLDGLEEGIRRIREYKRQFVSRLEDPTVPLDDVLDGCLHAYEDEIDMRHYLGMVERVEGSYDKLIEYRRLAEAAAARKEPATSDMVTPLDPEDVPKYVCTYFACAPEHIELFKLLYKRGLPKKIDCRKIEAIYYQPTYRHVCTWQKESSWDPNAHDGQGGWVTTEKSQKAISAWERTVVQIREQCKIVPLNNHDIYWQHVDQSRIPNDRFYGAETEDDPHALVPGMQYLVVDSYKNMLLISLGVQYWIVHKDLMTDVSL